MATFESRYTSLLQGVSQQIPRLRLPGQLSVQENMLSDAVTGIRRRPGTQYMIDFPTVGDHTEIRAWDTDIAGVRLQVVLDSRVGTVRLMDDTYTLLATLTSSELIAQDVDNIRVATVGEELFILNRETSPQFQPQDSSVLPPGRRGFFYTLAGAYSRKYTITVETGNGSTTVSYTTPNGQNAGDASLATPDYISTKLADAITEAGIGVDVYRTDAFVYLVGPEEVVVSTNTGPAYLIASQASRVRQIGHLPQILPAEADGYIVAVGETRLSQYYRYDAAAVAWQESGDYQSPSSITGMPVSLRRTDGTWEIASDPFEGRLAGDEETNPVPDWSRGLTGMGAFQGRLVLLSGSRVYLSSSKNPRRFFRSTVTSLLANDPIEVGASANSSAAYEYAVPFQKDLLLFSSKYQALIPSNGQAVTPANATVVVTSSLEMDVHAEPAPIGRTLLMATPAGAGYFGATEMIASQFTDAQYVSAPATAHLPAYMPGHCRFMIASSVGAFVLLAPSDDTHALIVHQYSWDGETKAQQAWHKWTFPYPLAAAYFVGEKINLLFVQNGRCVVAVLDPTLVGTGPESIPPYMDLYQSRTVVARGVDVPEWLAAFDPTGYERLVLGRFNDIPLRGSEVGVEARSPQRLMVVRSMPDGEPCTLGFKYTSTLSPTQPMIMDEQGAKIDTQKVTILRYGITTRHSQEYSVLVRDKHTTEDILQDQGALFFSSQELMLGSTPINEESRAVVPARTNADSTELVLQATGIGELNLVGIDYILRTRQKIRRF